MSTAPAPAPQVQAPNTPTPDQHPHPTQLQLQQSYLQQHFVAEASPQVGQPPPFEEDLMGGDLESLRSVGSSSFHTASSAALDGCQSGASCEPTPPMLPAKYHPHNSNYLSARDPSPFSDTVGSVEADFPAILPYKKSPSNTGIKKYSSDSDSDDREAACYQMRRNNNNNNNNAGSLLLGSAGGNALSRHFPSIASDRGVRLLREIGGRRPDAHPVRVFHAVHTPGSHHPHHNHSHNHVKAQQHHLLGCGGGASAGFGPAGRSVVVKYFRDACSEEALSEVRALERLGPHAGLVRPLDAFRQQRSLVLVLPQAGVSLAHRIPSLDHFARVAVAEQLIEVVEFLHASRVVHLDIKPHNVLVSRLSEGFAFGPCAGWTARLIDFGSAAVAPKGYFEPCAIRTTQLYAPPELMGVGRATPEPAADIWMLGTTVLHMVSREQPYKGVDYDNPFELAKLVLADPGLPKIPASVTDLWGDLLQACLERDPAHRPPAARLAYLVPPAVLAEPPPSDPSPGPSCSPTSPCLAQQEAHPTPQHLGQMKSDPGKCESAAAAEAAVETEVVAECGDTLTGALPCFIEEMDCD